LRKLGGKEGVMDRLTTKQESTGTIEARKRGYGREVGSVKNGKKRSPGTNKSVQQPQKLEGKKKKDQ